MHVKITYELPFFHRKSSLDCSKNLVLLLSISHAFTFVCTANRCVPLLYVPNSKPSTTNAVIGSTVTITCNTGYFFENNVKSRTMQCKTPGVWDPLLPACDRKFLKQRSIFYCLDILYIILHLCRFLSFVLMTQGHMI